ncbi:hypothetical protein HK104_010238 [Borealophlyctis nickersoniae]|nr:hypothetical protein HK104_010238 [Borealophlyctis nickersoniae]
MNDSIVLPIHTAGPDQAALQLSILQEQNRILSTKLAAAENDKALLSARADGMAKLLDAMRERIETKSSADVSASTSAAKPQSQGVDGTQQHLYEEQLKALTAKLVAAEAERAQLAEQAEKVHRLNTALRTRLLQVAGLSESGGGGMNEGVTKVWDAAVRRLKNHFDEAMEMRKVLDDAENALITATLSSPSPAAAGAAAKHRHPLARELSSASGFGSHAEDVGIGKIEDSPPPARRSRARALSWSGPISMPFGDRFAQTSRRSSGAGEASGEQAAGTVSPAVNREMLSLVPLFAGFPAAVMDKIQAIARNETKAQGETVILKGQRAEEMYIIVSGKVSILSGSSNDVATLGEENFFGDLGLSADSERSASVIAKTDCQLLVVPRNGFEEALAAHPDLRERVAKTTRGKREWLSKLQRRGSINAEDFGGEFLTDIARKDLGKLMMLSEADATFIENLVLTLNPEVHEPGSTIIEIGQSSADMFCILRGVVEVVGPTHQVHAEMVTGEFFGEVGLLYNMPRTASVRAKEVCFLLKLTKEGLEKVSNMYPEARRRVQQIADERYALFKKRAEALPQGSVGKQVVSGEAAGGDLDMDVTRQALTRMELFKGIEDNAAINELAASMTRKSWKAGETIIKCGERGNSMFLLAAGSVNFVTEFGLVCDTATGPNTYFGEVAILQDVPRTASVVAIGNGCSTYELRKEDVVKLMNRYPTVAAAIEEVASERLQAHLMRNVLA